ncbi:MAG: anthranilate phosphoribosyltransferase [Euryarchaeota archaeon]|jgi:anthranilate phosphoribosyltransferase|uniref:anthranilate phosphoribosyltransferase n=1 Tax=Methanobacterium sp. MZD130B TaxID=3394378 RepID=UPI001756EFBF|nr:anthranilate phosphoribosyltransferase [Euryarchaeota archaeon]HHT19287.1 anthranilate phosphoribosyltransferase [Methanobacterium sp.]
MITEGLKKVVSGQGLSEKEAYECMMDMVNGNASHIHISAFLAALATKGESISEITGFVKAMRQVSIKVNPQVDEPLVDTCGTGGDSFKTFNVSTISAIIAASCGVTIAKHGNRAISSKCGGADILEAMGVNIQGDARKVEFCLEKAGIGFMFAPKYHPAMGYVMPIRKKLGMRTVFNILGPLSSPANTDIHLMGVFDPDYVEILANVQRNLGVKRAMVVHGFDENGEPAMDEISTIGKTRAAFLDNGEIKIFELYPKDFGLKTTTKKLIKAPDTFDENLQIAMDVLEGKRKKKEEEARMDLSLANAGAILFLARKAETFEEGVEIAKKSVENGDAYNKLQEFVNASMDS